MNNSNNDGMIEGFLKEELINKRSDGEPAPHPLLAHIDDPVARSAVSTLITAYSSDESLPEFESTPLANAIMDYSGGESLYDSIEYGKVSKNSFLKGYDGADREYWNVRGFIESQWANAIDGQAVQKSLFNGDEGAGKSDMMMLEFFIIAPIVIHRETDKQVLGLSNIDVDVDTTELDAYRKVTKTSELDEVIEEFGDDDNWEVVLALDEGDILFGGSGKSSQRASELGNRIKLMRHNGFHIGMTSQRLVSPEIRNRFDVRHKPDENNPHICIFSKNTNKEGEPEDIVFRSHNIPATSVKYGSAGVWEHDVDSEGDVNEDEVEELEKEVESKERELNIRLKNLYNNTDMSYQDIANAIGDLTKDQVRYRVKKVSEK